MLQDRSAVIDFGVLPPTPGMIAGGVYQQPARAEAFARTCGFEPPAGLRSMSVDALIADMDEAGVSTAVIRGRQQAASLDGAVVSEPFAPSSLSAEESRTLMSERPGRFVAYAGVNEGMLDDPAKALDPVLSDERFRGVMLSPGYFKRPLYADDPRLSVLYDYCRTRALPTMINFGGNSGPDLSYTNPEIIDRVAARFPDLPLVVHHGGWPWVTQILHVAFRRTNVYLAPDQHLYGFPGWRDYVEAGNGFLRDRLLYASYYPFLPIPSSAERFRTMFDEEVHARLLHDNAQHLLSLRS